MKVRVRNKNIKNTEKLLDFSKDLRTIFAFKRWIQESLPIYADEDIARKKDDREASYEEVLLYLEYLLDVVRLNEDIDRSMWVKRISALISKCKKILRVNNE